MVTEDHPYQEGAWLLIYPLRSFSGVTKSNLPWTAGVAMAKSKTLTIQAEFKKETENFLRFDWADPNCRGRVYLQKDLALSALTIQLPSKGKISVEKEEDK